MTEDSSLDSKIAALAAKIDREARITRSALLLCTAAILGVILYTVTIMVGDLPQVILVNFQEGLQTTHEHWRALDKDFNSKHGIAAPVATDTKTSK